MASDREFAEMELTGRLLLVVADEGTAAHYRQVLEQVEGLSLTVATTAEQALSLAAATPPDMVLAEHLPPALDGMDLVAAMRTNEGLRGTGMVLISPDLSLADLAPTARIEDVISPVIAPGELLGKARVWFRIKSIHDELRADKVELERLHRQSEDRLQQLLELLVHIIDLSLPGSATRGRETARLAARVAERFEIPGTLEHDLDVAARLQELGKLLLRADRTDAEGPEDVREGDAWRYAVATKELLERTEGLGGAAELIGTMFENWDGTGHPDRLRQGQIPLRSRILRLVIDYLNLIDSGEVPDADAALAQLRQHAGTRYDPLAVAHFDAILAAPSQAAWRETRIRLPVHSLAEGMVVAEDLTTSAGVKLMAKGAVITSAILDTILRRHRSDPIVPGVWVERASMPA
ncbi:MAG: HD domain-containing phosphohydrolase [Gemmatimonadales bacterium]